MNHPVQRLSMSPSTQQQIMEMGDMAEDDTKRHANLARIRDNQRRSRARRKEYLTELEEKYRTCEKVGAEASAEIQAAARRVLEENKAILDENNRLRQLLKQRGLSEADIDGWTAEGVENPQYPSAESVALEKMMGQRKACGPGCVDPSKTKTVDVKPVIESRPVSAQPSAPVTQPRLPIQPSVPQHHSPLSIASDTFTPTSAHLPLSQSYHPPMDTEQSLQPMDHEHYSDSLLWQNQYTSPPPGTGMAESSSCYVAAGAIRAIKPDIGYELEHELGCGAGQECSVPNSQIYGIMERYSFDSVARSGG